MNKRTLIAGLVLFAGAPVAAQINDVDPNSDTKIARRAARVNPAAERALVARSNPIDVGGVVYHGSARVIPLESRAYVRRGWRFDHVIRPDRRRD